MAVGQSRYKPITMLRFDFDNTYVRDLPEFYVSWKPTAVAAPRLLFLNRELAGELGLDADALEGPEGAALFAGNLVPPGAEPIAQAYAGHQFGGFSPQLGDGRALLLGEVVDRRGRRRDIAFKGSGRTPFSRNGDGRAAVGPMLREVLIGEAMHALGIPTTRALAVAATGEAVYRDQPLPGAVLTRVAASHLRVGTFQYFAARGQFDQLRQLVDYSIARHYPDLVGAPDRLLALLRAVAQRQAALIARWMNVGFIHGVMNTDNMTISGETIDYGPCAFMESYDPATVFSSIDHDGRYAYGNQPRIARWNLARFAETLLPLMADDDEAAQQRAVAQATDVIDAFVGWYDDALLQGQRAKLGLYMAAATDVAHIETDQTLADDWLALLQAQAVDFTRAWRRLADAADADDATHGGGDAALRAEFADAAALDGWLARWRQACARDDMAGGPGGAARAARMRSTSPWVIARNHRVEEALAAASSDGDLGPFERLLAALRRPYDETPEQAPYAEAAPASVAASYRTFCGT
jgi:serine/tyrosine/threonine adenylyltransferase